MTTRRSIHDPKHAIETADGDMIEVQMWYRDGEPDHISVDNEREAESMTFSLDDPDVAIEIGYAIVDLARRLPPPGSPVAPADEIRFHMSKILVELAGLDASETERIAALEGRHAGLGLALSCMEDPTDAPNPVHRIGDGR